MAARRRALDVLAHESRALVARLRLWTPARYAASAPVASAPGAGTRGDLVHHLAQSFADLAAPVEAGGGVPRRLPRLDSDLALADQLAVTADDLVRSEPGEDVAVAATAHLLLHRTHLLDDEIPSGLARALGLVDVGDAGQRACDLTAPRRLGER